MSSSTRDIIFDFSTQQTVENIRTTAASKRESLQELSNQLNAAGSNFEVVTSLDLSSENHTEVGTSAIYAEQVREVINSLIYTINAAIPDEAFDAWFTLWNMKFSEKIAALQAEDTLLISQTDKTLQELINLANENKILLAQAPRIIGNLLTPVKASQKKAAEEQLTILLHTLESFNRFYDSFNQIQKFLKTNHLDNPYHVFSTLEISYRIRPDINAISTAVDEIYKQLPNNIRNNSKAYVRNHIDRLETFLGMVGKFYHASFNGKLAKYADKFAINARRIEAVDLPSLVRDHNKKVAEALEEERVIAYSKAFNIPASRRIEEILRQNLFLYLKIQLQAASEERLKLISADNLPQDSKPHLLNAAARKAVLEGFMLMRNAGVALLCLHGALSACEVKQRQSMYESIHEAIETRIKEPEQKVSHEEILLIDKRRTRLLEKLRREEERGKNARLEETRRIDAEKQQAQQEYNEQRTTILANIRQTNPEQYALIGRILAGNVKHVNISKQQFVELVTAVGFCHSSTQKGGKVVFKQNSFSFYSPRRGETTLATDVIKEFKKLLEQAGISSKDIPERQPRTGISAR